VLGQRAADLARSGPRTSGATPSLGGRTRRRSPLHPSADPVSNRTYQPAGDSSSAVGGLLTASHSRTGNAGAPPQPRPDLLHQFSAGQSSGAVLKLRRVTLDAAASISSATSAATSPMPSGLSERRLAGHLVMGLSTGHRRPSRSRSSGAVIAFLPCCSGPPSILSLPVPSSALVR